MLQLLNKHARRIAALVVVLAFYGLAHLPDISPSESNDLTSSYSFARNTLTVSRADGARLYPVRKSLEIIQGWISSVGASVALTDLDGDGYPDDACYIDTRTRQVRIEKVSQVSRQTGRSFYAPFSLALKPEFLTNDPESIAPTGCLPGDFNEDGLMDILVYYWGRTPVLFLRMPDSSPGQKLSLNSYAQVPLLDSGDWYTNAATIADVDGDGHADLIIGNYFADGSRVLDAKLTDPAKNIMQDSMSRAYNGGGVRVFLWKSATSGQAPGVRFEEVKNFLGEKSDADSFPNNVKNGWVLALGAYDFDGDLRPEIYIANDFAPDALLHNRTKTSGTPKFARLFGHKQFTTPNSKVLGQDSFKGMGVDFGDLDGDGLPDIFVSNITTNLGLQESNFAWINTGNSGDMERGIAPFTDQSEPKGLSRSGWSWDARIADFNNDGVPEILQAVGFVQGQQSGTNRWPELQELAMGNDHLLRDPVNWPRFQDRDEISGINEKEHNRFFVRSKSGRYFDLSDKINVETIDGSMHKKETFVVPEVSRGIATADVDGDGRLDFAIATQWGPTYFFHNESPRPGTFIGLRLSFPVGDATAAGRPAIGASVEVILPDGKQRLVGQVDGGTGHSGKKSPDLHFGLGAIPTGTPLTVKIYWRDIFGCHELKKELSVGKWHPVTLQGGTPPESKCKTTVIN